MIAPPEGHFFEDGDDPRFVTVVRRLQEGRAAEPLLRGKHPQCSKSCNPRSEASLIHDGYLKGPPISSNVYICAYGSLHVCSKTSCEYYGAQHDQTCHVSGIQHGTVVSSYDANDYRTWKPQIPAAAHQPIPTSTGKKRKTFSAPSSKATAAAASDIAERAETIVVNLLFSSMRTQRNLTATITHRKAAQKSKQSYAYERKTHHHQLPYLSELHKRSAWALQCELPLKELERDDSLIAYYVAVIVQLYNKVRTHCVFEHRIDPDAIALGALYMLRQGYIDDGRVFLAVDAFLAEHLPRINDMVFFGFDRNKITDGMRMLLALYTSVKIAPEALMLDVTLLPQRQGAATADNKIIKL
jgi:hypothetical protein